MIKIDKEFENLSAYLDDELSPTEKEIFKERLQSSPALRERLNSYSRIKNQLGGVKSLPEDHFFETRLSEEIAKQTTGMRRYFNPGRPALLFASLTVVLMFVVKVAYDPFMELIDEQQTNIKDFYTANLRPLFNPDQLSNEELFNFAMNRVLPLDESGERVLTLSEGESGGDYFEIRQTSDGRSELNLEEFASKLNLGPGERRQMDSILNSYSDKIAKAVLVNDNNTVAINPMLMHYNMALRADLVKFAHLTAEKSKHITRTVVSNLPVIPDINLSQLASNFDPNQYICLAPDTSFLADIDVDLQNINKNAYAYTSGNKNGAKTAYVGSVPSIKKKYQKVYVDSVKNKKFMIFSDSNFIKIQVPQFDATMMNDFSKQMDSISKEIDKAVSKLKFEFRIDTIKVPNAMSFDFNFNAPNVKIPDLPPLPPTVVIPKFDSAFNFNMKFPSFNVDSLSSFYFNMSDSLLNFGVYGNDTLKLQFNKDFQKEMEALRKDMERFRKDMEKWKDDLRKNNVKPPKKKPVEI
ncbi:MAG: hypothetical protein L6Q59_12335 [Ignavibacteriaceae bacterium]|nr:hypothetical protein [Ignavibacteriaceae bacterium]